MVTSHLILSLTNFVRIHFKLWTDALKFDVLPQTKKRIKPNLKSSPVKYFLLLVGWD
jgi:hypothetical protein